MDILITCNNCDTAFELTEIHEFKENEILQCPNCRAKLPKTACEDLAHLVQAYNSLQKHLTVESDLGQDTPFKVAVSD